MVEKVRVELEDDLDGSAAEETIRFSYRGNDYAVDLSAKNAAAFDRAIDKFIAAARPARTGGRRPASSGRASSRSARAPRATGREDLAAIRAWAAANGYQVSRRGRIPAQILDAYNAAR